jgi:hypothetical protein
MKKEVPLKWIPVVGVFLIIAGGRILRLSLDDKELHVDEVWSVWQLMGTHKNYTLDTNWPPLYIIGLDVWKEVAGIHPVTLRFYSVLLFMLGVAFTYRALKGLRNESPGLLFTTEVRANALIFSLMPLAFWLTIRYFDSPNWRRALVLGIVMAAMFYTAFTAFGAFLMLGLYTLYSLPAQNLALGAARRDRGAHCRAGNQPNSRSGDGACRGGGTNYVRFIFPGYRPFT